jgi:hypothetical protein
MIRFRCRQCDKPFERPNDAAGTLVFCTCGTGNRVPWDISPDPPRPAESQVPEAEEQPLRMKPLDDQSPSSRDRPDDRPHTRMRDSACCFNHQTVAVEQNCEDCKEGFCAACLVSLQGRTLCGPCKNFRLRRMQKPPRMSALAIAALAVALVGAPFGLFCFTFAGAGMGLPGLGFVGLLLPLVALVLGGLALREIETNPQVSGRSLAIASVVTALAFGYLIAIITVTVGQQM